MFCLRQIGCIVCSVLYFAVKHTEVHFPLKENHSNSNNSILFFFLVVMELVHRKN